MQHKEITDKWNKQTTKETLQALTLTGNEIRLEGHSIFFLKNVRVFNSSGLSYVNQGIETHSLIHSRPLLRSLNALNVLSDKFVSTFKLYV